jgi:hypothetical protein
MEFLVRRNCDIMEMRSRHWKKRVIMLVSSTLLKTISFKALTSLHLYTNELGHHNA